MPTESTMLRERPAPSRANREDVDPTFSEACRVAAVTGKTHPAIALFVAYARDKALAEALEIRA